jgi:hypothetical protein
MVPRAANDKTGRKSQFANASSLYFLHFVAQFKGSMRRILMLIAVLSPALVRADAGDLAKSSVLENDVAYLRVNNVSKNLLGEIQTARNALMSSNKLAGFIVDLRFAGGETTESAADAAGLLAHEKLPVAVLINDQTHGAALELTKQLQAAHSGLVFGGAGAAIKPDITVPVNAADERLFYENPYSVASTNIVPAAARTNDFLPFIDHTSEADLVRARIKDGELEPSSNEGDNSSSSRAAEPVKPFLRDPVLARGVDFIKGLAVLRLSRS